MALLTKTHPTGFSLIEVLIALTLFLVLSIGSLAANGLTTNTVTINQKRSQANRLAREAMEALYSIRAADFLSLTPGQFHPVLSGNNWTLVSGSQQIGDFSRQITLSTVMRGLVCDSPVCDIIPAGGIVDEGSLQATTTVSWTESGQTKQVSLDSLITYWR